MAFSPAAINHMITYETVYRHKNNQTEIRQNSPDAYAHGSQYAEYGLYLTIIIAFASLAFFYRKDKLRR